MVYHRELNIAPCAAQQEGPRCLPFFQFVSANPELRLLPTPVPHGKGKSALCVCESISE